MADIPTNFKKEKPRDKRKGPRQITFKFKRCSFIFRNIEGSIYFEFKGIRESVSIKLKGAQIRRLRNWLNWFLDNK